jgi:hypothetical protein
MDTEDSLISSSVVDMLRILEGVVQALQQVEPVRCCAVKRESVPVFEMGGAAGWRTMVDQRSRSGLPSGVWDIEVRLGVSSAP